MTPVLPLIFPFLTRRGHSLTELPSVPSLNQKLSLSLTCRHFSLPLSFSFAHSLIRQHQRELLSPRMTEIHSSHPLTIEVKCWPACHCSTQSENVRLWKLSSTFSPFTCWFEVSWCWELCVQVFCLCIWENRGKPSAKLQESMRAERRIVSIAVFTHALQPWTFLDPTQRTCMSECKRFSWNWHWAVFNLSAPCSIVKIVKVIVLCIHTDWVLFQASSILYPSSTLA